MPIVRDLFGGTRTLLFLTELGRWRIGALPDLCGDGSTLKLMVANLVLNAIKCTRTRPSAEIAIGSGDQPSGRVVVFVRDNGVGFEMKYVV
jgi:two-component system, chemotaxis family, sensor kinase Cph1